MAGEEDVVIFINEIELCLDVKLSYDVTSLLNNMYRKSLSQWFKL